MDWGRGVAPGSAWLVHWECGQGVWEATTKGLVAEDETEGLDLEG